MLGVAGVASKAQEPVLQPPALQVAVEWRVLEKRSSSVN
jgi:hypothetical protein